MTHWTKEKEDQLLELIKAGFTINECAMTLKRSYCSIERKLFKLRQKGRAKAVYPKKNSLVETPKESADAPEAQDDLTKIAFWRGRVRELEREVASLEKLRTANEVIAEEFLSHAPKSYAPPEFALNQHMKEGVKDSRPQSAMLLLSDTHIGAVVKADQTLGLGQYSFETFLRRLWRLERSVFSILKDHTTTPVPEIVIPMIGDMLDGALVHAAECGQANTILKQFYSGAHALAQFLRNLSVIAPLRIYGVVGNHTRWGHQHKMPSKNRNSNFDMLLYLYLEALTKDLAPRIQWNLDSQPFQTFEVQGFQFYAAHGDNIRGGDKTLGLPAHSMGRMISTTNQLFTRAKRQSPDYFLLGHLHRPIEIPHAKGAVIVNGAFPGIDGYALTEYFNSSHPIQKFWLMHPKFGRSATYDLRLDLGDDTPHGYTLPERFSCE
jgi:predicted MPP superfamily phosphohydrolase